MNFLLDTSVVVKYLRDKPGAWKFVNKLLDEGELKFSLISYGELEYGARLADNYEKEKSKVEECVDKLLIEILPMTMGTMEVYAKARRTLEKKGEGLDDFDLLIGATAVENELVLVTDNEKHFARFPGLKVYKRD
ncbi:MAG: VapC-like nucleic acid-binding protein [Microgenomates group bacterium Gr01-1014_16]|nr:MAG: VapC-like nucleic acid-binding protein [Microgenomates group bacterium Gr01-1014_16]